MMPSAKSTRDQAVSARSEVEQSIEALSTRLVTGSSATAVLEAWCEERGLGSTPRLVARRIEATPRALDALQVERLHLEAGSQVRYRRVRLVCGVHLLSEAENWYVPARLTPEMNRLLETTEMPFGRVVHTLAPVRRNLRLRRIWPPETERAPGPSDALFSIQALLTGRDGVPLCEVGETYTGAILARGG